MSLIHWWPLNGDLKDKVGGRHGTILGNANVTTSGKLGQCLSGMTGEQTTAGVSVDNCNLLDEISTEYSAAVWIKIHGTHVHYEGAFISSGNWNNQRWTFGIGQANNKIQPLTNASNQNYISLGKTLENERWYHVVTVYKDGTAYLYLDGVFVNSVAATAPNQSSATNLCIGRETYASGYFSFNGDICDVRIYDHALSLAEVKELSKALVLHYTFDDDLACGTTNEAPISGWSTYGSYWTLLERTSHGLKIQRASSTASPTVAIQNNSLKSKMANGDIWTFSCYLYKNGQPYKSSCTEISSPTSYYYKTQSWESREDGYYRNTFKITGNPGTWMLHNNFFGTAPETGIQYEMRYIQFEKRDFASSYTATTRNRSLANEAGYTCTNSANDVEFTGVSRIGQRAIYCKDGLQRISATVPYLASDVLSTSIWFKTKGSPSANNLTAPKNGYHILLAVDSGRVEISVPTAGQLRFGGYNKTASSRFCSNFSATILDGNWHLINTVFDGLTWKGYVDGVLKGTITVTSTNGDSPIIYNNKKLTIGRYYDDATSNYGATDAYIDDVRIYNSVLTESDIKDLYNIGMRITKSGDFITNEFVEVTTGNMVATSDWKQEGIQDANGASAGTMNNRLATKYIPVLPNTNYYYAVNSGMNVCGAHYYTEDLTWIRTDQPTKNSFTAITPANCAYVRFVIQSTTASNDVPLANIATYGPTMRPAQFNEKLPLATKIEAKPNKNQIFTCLDICEGHSPKILSDGKMATRQIIET